MNEWIRREDFLSHMAEWKAKYEHLQWELKWERILVFLLFILVLAIAFGVKLSHSQENWPVKARVKWLAPDTVEVDLHRIYRCPGQCDQNSSEWELSGSYNVIENCEMIASGHPICPECAPCEGVTTYSFDWQPGSWQSFRLKAFDTDKDPWEQSAYSNILSAQRPIDGSTTTTSTIPLVLPGAPAFMSLEILP